MIELVPENLQAQVFSQRYFQQALRMALSCREPRTVIDTAVELRAVAHNAMLAIESARLRDGDSSESLECARTAAIQGLAAVAGAELLDRAACALSSGAHRQFTAGLRRSVGLPIPQPAGATGPRPGVAQ